MIKVSDKAMQEICDKLSIPKETLKYIGGGSESSDGILYVYDSQSGRMVLKILAIPEKEIDKLRSLELRVKFANLLGENGINLAYPIRNQNGNLYETSIDNQHIYTAYVMEFTEGKNPESNELTDELLVEWGRITGKSHKITKGFTDGDNFKGLDHKAEVEFFTDWCEEPFVKSVWSDIGGYLDTLPMGKDEYGFIHNDNHQRNILVQDKNITIIDFDCSAVQFFIQDIITPAQGVMFDIYGGMVSPLSEAERLKRFFYSFINGYEKENHLSDFWYKEITNFINYRRLLLFTCMQSWINTQPELKNGFIENIKNPPRIII